MQNVLFKANTPIEEDLSVMLGKYVPITAITDKPAKNMPEQNGLSTFSLYDYDYTYKTERMERRLRADIFFVKKLYMRLKSFFAGKKYR